MRHLGIVVMIYVGLVVQSSLVPADLAGGRPFVPALLLVLISILCQGSPAILWSGLMGLVLDGLSTERLGVQLGLAALLALGLQLLRSAWSSRSLLSLVALVLVTGFAWRALSPMAQAVVTGRVVDPHRVLMDAVQDATWTAGVAVVVLLVGRGIVGAPRRPRTLAH